MKLLQKLLEIRRSVEYIQKTEQGERGMYVDPAALLKTIRDKMDTTGVILVPAILGASVESIPQPTKNNPNAMGFLFSSPMEYTWYDCGSEEKLPVSWFCTGKHMTDPAMAQGSSLTYSERYFLLKFFQIPTSKDDPEYFAKKTKEKEPAPQITITPEDVNWLMGFYKSHGITTKELVEDFKKKYKFNPYKTTPEQFAKIKNQINTDYNEAS
jgi:hypothetical protein